MARSSTRRNPRPRELRRRVMLPARVRTTAGWSDACILDLSSRGAMVRANFIALEDGSIELWHGDHAITARIVWRDGLKAGVQAAEPIPVEEILSSSAGPPLQPAARSDRVVDRRKRRRTYDRSRIKGRAFEFASVATIAATLGLGFSSWLYEALAQPLALITRALGN